MALTNLRNFTIPLLTSLASSARALMREEKMPLFTSSVTIEDQSHAEHTSNAKGSFVHPFLKVAPEVQTIYYAKSKTISKKLHRVHGPSRHHEQNTENRVIGNTKKETKLGIWDQLVSWVSPFGSSSYQTSMQNYWNTVYVGEIYMGSEMQ